MNWGGVCPFSTQRPGMWRWLSHKWRCSPERGSLGYKRLFLQPPSSPPYPTKLPRLGELRSSLEIYFISMKDYWSFSESLGLRDHYLSATVCDCLMSNRSAKNILGGTAWVSQTCTKGSTTHSPFRSHNDSALCSNQSSQEISHRVVRAVSCLSLLLLHSPSLRAPTKGWVFSTSLDWCCDRSFCWQILACVCLIQGSTASTWNCRLFPE